MSAGTDRRAGWQWTEPTPPQPVLHEKVPPAAPILYGPNGQPLFPAVPVVGFKREPK